MRTKRPGPADRTAKTLRDHKGERGEGAVREGPRDTRRGEQCAEGRLASDCKRLGVFMFGLC